MTAGRDHPLRFEEREDGPRPISMSAADWRRWSPGPVYYDLAAMALANDDVPPGVWSDGVFFPLEPTE